MKRSNPEVCKSVLHHHLQKMHRRPVVQAVVLAMQVAGAWIDGAATKPVS